MRRICSTTLCALLLIALSAQAAMADSVTSPAGSAGSATYTDDAGEEAELDVRSFDATTIEFQTQAGDTITESGDCFEVNPTTTHCPATRATVNLRDGDDFVDGVDANDHVLTLNGGGGDDELIGGDLGDTINGDAGDDTPNGNEGNDTVNGGDGDDEIEGGQDNDDLNGGEDNDVLLGDPGDDSMDGGADDDWFVFFVVIPGADDIVGGAGIDRLVQMAFSPLAPPAGTVDVSYSLNDAADDGESGQGTNVHSDVEDLTGTLTEIQEHGSFVFPYYTGPPLVTGEGKVTLRGSNVDNVLMGGTNDDDIDALLGNDHLIGGDGNDTLRSADGFHDRLKCGPGTDTAEADTLDTISESCENVTRADVGNANDVPEIPEDLPPAVSFVSPAAGAVTTGVTPLVAAATDDRGVAAVQFVDDDQVVCNDTEAPYTCDYQPRGEDVGRNTLSVVATDTAGQTASARRLFVVPRFAPVSVSLRLTPRRDATMPIRFRSRGRVTLPPQVTPALGCVGSFVAIQVKAGRTTISNRRVRVRPDCSFRSRVTFSSRRRFRSRRRLRVVAVYAGNSVLTTARSSRRSIRIR